MGSEEPETGDVEALQHKDPEGWKHESFPNLQLDRERYLAAGEDYAETVRHLKAAGLIVLLVLDENTAKDGTLKNMDGFYSNWQIDGITVKDAIDFVKKKSVFAVQNAQDGNYI